MQEIPHVSSAHVGEFPTWTEEESHLEATSTTIPCAHSFCLASTLLSSLSIHSYGGECGFLQAGGWVTDGSTRQELQAQHRMAPLPNLSSKAEALRGETQLPGQLSSSLHLVFAFCLPLP